MQFPDINVTLLEIAGSDHSIADAARVSLLGESNRDRDGGLINALMQKKHGSPFEHNMLKFHVEAPIFVFREFHRHRIGFSYNEMSGRYMELPDHFYLPPIYRPLLNVGTSMNPQFQPAPDMHGDVTGAILLAYKASWDAYQYMLKLGIANEVARVVLPVGIMSQMIVTCNVRSLLHFLSLRIDDPRATFPSKPQWEIQLVATMMENHLQLNFPLTYKAYNDNGRVAP